MVNAKKPTTSIIRDCLGESGWIDIETISDVNDKWSKKEGEKLIELLSKILVQKTPPDLYIITPFRDVAYNIRQVVKASGILQSWKIINPDSWLSERIGTVHTVQGREAEAVIFVLGAPSKDQRGARNWAGARPNLLNVATTRAKEVFYVIGNKKLWCQAGVFAELADRI